MFAWRGQSALYLAPEPYELLLLSSERGSKYPWWLLHRLAISDAFPWGAGHGTLRDTRK